MTDTAVPDASITAHALALPHTFMTEQWMGSHVFKVGDANTAKGGAFKMFAVLLPGKHRLTLKTPDPDIAAMLIEAGVASRNVHLPRGGWVQLHTDSMDADDVLARISESYAVCARGFTKVQRRKFGFD